MKVQPRTLTGFMELLPNEQVLFTYYRNVRSFACKSWRGNGKTNLSI